MWETSESEEKKGRLGRDRVGELGSLVRFVVSDSRDPEIPPQAHAMNLRSPFSRPFAASPFPSR